MVSTVSAGGVPVRADLPRLWGAVNVVPMDLSGPKRGYHHGDLRNALGDAAAQLAREGGPESVTVRAAARLAGVTPTAAYRHYGGHEELLAEAKQQCLARLGAAIETALTGLTALPEPADHQHRAVRDLAVAGRAYVDFALAEPGLFRTAFCPGGAVPGREHLAASAFGQLIRLIDRLTEVGYLPARHRPLAEVAAWASVHGLAMLLLDGPLRDVPRQTKDEAVARTILAMGHGLAGAARLSPELEELVLAAARRQV